MEDFTDFIPLFIILILSGSVHELCHAWSAFRLGDSTSRDLGRLNLNPLVHVDLMGTLIFPVLTFYMMGLPFGWMKPVPVAPGNLHHPRRDMLIVSLAGPFSNLYLAMIGFLGLLLITWTDATVSEAVQRALMWWVHLNLLLAFFNLLPIPPLDGSAILAYFLGDKAGKFHSQGYMGFIFLIFMFMIGFRYLGIAIQTTYTTMLALPVLPLVLLAVLTALTVIFLIKTAKPAPRKKEKGKGKSEQQVIYTIARQIGKKLAAGTALTSDEKKWKDTVSRDLGDGDALCAPVSFDPENEFCGGCPNFKRCATRLMNTIEEEKEPPARDP